MSKFLALYEESDLDYKASMLDSMYTRKDILYLCCKLYSKLNKCCFMTSFVRFRSYSKGDLIYWYLEHKY